MSSHIYDVLSLWEIAHRWHDAHPDDDGPVPMAVQDTLRLLAKAAAQHDLELCSEAGVPYKNLNNTLEYDDYVKQLVMQGEVKEPLTSKQDDEAYEQWQRYYNGRLARHAEATEDFESIFRHRKIDRQLLSERYTRYHALKSFCDAWGYEFPRFWTIKGVSTGSDTLSAAGLETRELKPSQQDRLCVQAVARTLWDQEPDATIAALKTHYAIRKHANGELYSDKTLHRWIAEVDRREPEKKAGRPRKKSSGNQ